MSKKNKKKRFNNQMTQDNNENTVILEETENTEVEGDENNIINENEVGADNSIGEIPNQNEVTDGATSDDSIEVVDNKQDDVDDTSTNNETDLNSTDISEENIIENDINDERPLTDNEEQSSPKAESDFLPSNSEKSSETISDDNSKNDGEKLDDNSKEHSAVDEEKAEKKRIKKEKQKERRAKSAAWAKAHKLLIFILSLVLAVVIGVVVAHFVTTAKMVFIHNAEDLIEASAQNKKSELKFKSDITIDGNLDLSGYTLDLDKYTLTVKGNLNVKNKDSFIGKQKYLWSDFTVGGKIVCDRLFIDGESVKLYSNVVADNVVILAKTAEILNGVSGKSQETTDIWFLRNENESALVGSFCGDNGEIILKSLMENANLHSAMNSVVYCYGNINNISGGEKVHLKPNSITNYVEGCIKLFIEEKAIWKGFDANTVENYYFVQKLETPEILIVNGDNGYEIRISNVDNADAYMVVYDGMDSVRVEKTLNGNYTVYTLPYKAPGSYSLTVSAVSNNQEQYNDGDARNLTVEIYETLEQPDILSCKERVNENGETSFVVTIQNVANAKTYELSVNGQKLTVDATANPTVDVDITSIVNGKVGTYNIFAKAVANGTNYKESVEEIYSFVYTKKLALGEITKTVTENGILYSWVGLEGAIGYMVSYGDESRVITNCEIVLSEDTILAVKPLGKGYYKDGEFVYSSTPEVKPTPEPEPTPEPTPEPEA